MWLYLQSLPRELVGDHIFGFLSLKDLVELDNSFMARSARAEFLELLPYCPPVNIEQSIRPDAYGLSWFKKRKCRILHINLKLQYKNLLEIDITQVQNISFDISRTLTMNDVDNLILSGIALKIKCVEGKNISNINTEVLNRLLAATPHLNELSLTEHTNTALSFLDKIAFDHITLHTIHLSVHHLSSSLIKFFSNHCGKLKNLEVFASNSNEDPNILLQTIVGKCPLLEDLLIYTAHVPNKRSFNIDNCMIAIAQICVNLQDIKLHLCSITDMSVLAIAQHCPNLRKLLLFSKDSSLTHISLLALSEHKLPKEKLNIPSIPIPTADIALRCVHTISRMNSFIWPVSGDAPGHIHYLAVLKCLNFPSDLSTEIPERVLAAITAHCRQLESINVSATNNSSLDLLVTMAKNNPNLLSVHLRPGAVLTDVILTEVAKHCPQLTSIEVTDCPLLTDTGLIALSEYCPRLTSIILQNCPLLTDAGLIALSQHCPGLTSFTLENCPQCTDVGLIALSENCRRLKYLTLSDFPHVTDKTVLALSQNNHRYLYWLTLPHNCQVTEAAVVELVQRCRGLHHLNIPTSCISEQTNYNLLVQRGINQYTGFAELTIGQ